MTPAATTTGKLPPRISERSRLRGMGFVVAVVVLRVLAVLFKFNPAENTFYPRCAFYSMTGLQCPGCGGLRAAHQLLHGHFAAAWALNPLAVLLAPVFFWLGLDACLARFTQRRLPRLRFTQFTLWLCVITLVVFGVLRNLR